jgi:hypothetical protein
MKPGVKKSKPEKFYRYTHELRLFLLIFAVFIMCFERPPWCQNLIDVWKKDSGKFNDSINNLEIESTSDKYFPLFQGLNNTNALFEPQ